MSSHLTPEELADVRAELQRERARLERSVALSGDAAKPVTLEQGTVGRLSRMNELQNQHMAANLHDRENARLAQVIDALERIEAGTYGSCARCDRALPYGRLMVFPEARLCLACEGRAH